MKAEYVNPFFQATKEVFKLMLDLEINRGRGQAEDLQQALKEKEVSITIGVTGDLSGAIIYRFPESMVLEIVRIMSGMEMKAIDEFVTSALGEVSNIISGNAVTSLFNQNYQCDILPPRIEIAEPAMGEKDIRRTLRVPLEAAIGNMEIDIFLEENKSA